MNVLAMFFIFCAFEELNIRHQNLRLIIFYFPSNLSFPQFILQSILCQANLYVEFPHFFSPTPPQALNSVTTIVYAIGRRQRKTADAVLVLSEVEGQRSVDGSFTHTTLKIYNILGQKVRTLVDEPKGAGSYELIWDGKDDEEKMSPEEYIFIN